MIRRRDKSAFTRLHAPALHASSPAGHVSAEIEEGLDLRGCGNPVGNSRTSLPRVRLTVRPQYGSACRAYTRLAPPPVFTQSSPSLHRVFSHPPRSLHSAFVRVSRPSLGFGHASPCASCSLPACRAFRYLHACVCNESRALREPGRGSADRVSDDPPPQCRDHMDVSPPCSVM